MAVFSVTRLDPEMPKSPAAPLVRVKLAARTVPPAFVMVRAPIVARQSAVPRRPDDRGPTTPGAALLSAGALASVNVELSADEITSLDESLVPHAVFGFV
jgi:hypothetical protein